MKKIYGYHKSTYERMIIHLRQLGNNEINPKITGMGVCRELMNLFDFSLQQFNYRFIDIHQCNFYFSYNKWSGNIVFPVIDPETKTAELAFFNYVNLWNSETEYGRNRREFCLFLAEQFEKIVSDNFDKFVVKLSHQYNDAYLKLLPFDPGIKHIKRNYLLTCLETADKFDKEHIAISVAKSVFKQDDWEIVKT